MAVFTKVGLAHVQQALVRGMMDATTEGEGDVGDKPKGLVPGVKEAAQALHAFITAFEKATATDGDAVDLDDYHAGAQKLVQRIPALTEYRTSCPEPRMVADVEWDELEDGTVVVTGERTVMDDDCYYCTDTALVGVIMHLNDDHDMSREEIADWLDSLTRELDVDLRIGGPDGS